MRRLLLLLVTTAATLGAGLVAAAPAQAAAPTCTSWSTFNHDDGVVHVPSAGYQTGTLNCILKQGHRNDAVKVLQRALRYCHDKQYIQVDGDFGPYTKSAVLAMQIWVNRNYHWGIAEDGEYGPQTRQWINYVQYTSPGNQQTPWCGEAPY